MGKSSKYKDGNGKLNDIEKINLKPTSYKTKKESYKYL